MGTDAETRPSIEQIELRLMDYMERELLSPDVKLDRQDDLLSGELLDSIGALRLAAFIEKEYRIDMQSSGFVVENFQSIATLAEFVRGAFGPADDDPGTVSPQADR